MTTAADRAVVLLSGPGLGSVVSELARRFGASDRPVVSVTATLDDAGRVAVAELLGLPRLPPGRCRLQTRALADALDIPVEDLPAVIGEIAGPVGNRARTLQAARAERDAALEAVAATAEPMGAAVVEWARQAVRSLPGTIVGRVEDVNVVLQVLDSVRAEPELLPVLAARATGDPHGFDAGTRCGELLVGCAAAAAGQGTVGSTLARRAVLYRFGIVADELSSTVSAWRLPFPSSHPLRAAGRALTDAGEPAVLSLSMVQRWPVSAPGERVLVVENPSVLATAAARRFPGPVVCSSGQPSAAVAQLVSQLANSEADVVVHADFDPGGFAVVNSLAALGARPWRMGADDYAAALERSQAPWEGDRVPATPWSPELRGRFVHERRVVYQEQLLDVILEMT